MYQIQKNKLILPATEIMTKKFVWLLPSSETKKNAVEAFFLPSIKICSGFYFMSVVFAHKLNTHPFCSDFRYESNGIFVLGWGFFFFRQISTF